MTKFFNTSVHEECAEKALNKFYTVRNGVVMTGREIEQAIAEGKLTQADAEQVIEYGLSLQAERDAMKARGIETAPTADIKTRMQALRALVVKQRTAIEDDRRQALEQLDKLPAGISSSMIEDAKTLIEHTYRTEIAKLGNGTREELDRIKKANEDYTKAFYALRPDQIDMGVISLLDQIDPTADMIDTLLDQYRSNATMERVLLKRAKDAGIITEKTVLCQSCIDHPGKTNADALGIMGTRIEAIADGNAGNATVWSDASLFDQEYNRLLSDGYMVEG